MVQALFRRDHKYYSQKNWALLYLRIAYNETLPYSLVYSFNGVPNPISGGVDFFGTFVNSVPFKFEPMIPTGLTYSIIHGELSEVYLRNF
jgi:hypothetical protein